ncbi:MAG: rhodanese-like domain-containing protein [Prevotellaceae bacterium]|nr:rhodanese-like domain-containing protein [Prevotellaceae bacterium]
MKIKLSIVMAIFSFLFGCTTTQRTFDSVSAEEFQKILSQPRVVCLDVRTPDEYNSSHIKNAININVLSEDFEQQVVSRLAKGETIAVYCRSGNRSKKACSILVKNKYKKVVELSSGINGWVDAGMETVSK